MKMFKQVGLLLALLSVTSLATADDTDIYLNAGAAAAAPPYLMLMIDYRPSVFSTFCNGLNACIPKMTVNSFMALCSRHAFPDHPDATLASKRSACRQYFYANGGE